MQQVWPNVVAYGLCEHDVSLIALFWLGSVLRVLLRVCSGILEPLVSMLSSDPADREFQHFSTPASWRCPLTGMLESFAGVQQLLQELEIDRHFDMNEGQGDRTPFQIF